MRGLTVAMLLSVTVALRRGAQLPSLVCSGSAKFSTQSAVQARLSSAQQVPLAGPPRGIIRPSTPHQPNIEPAYGLTVPRLRDALKVLGLDHTGRKAALVERLEQSRLEKAGTPLRMQQRLRMSASPPEQAHDGQWYAAVAPAPARVSDAAPLERVMVQADGSSLHHGVVKRIMHHSPSFAVMQLSLPKGSRPSILTICASNGCLGAVQVGMELSVRGQMQRHPDYGKQLAVQAVEAAKPVEESVGGPRAVLTSGAIKGIGPAKAAALLHKFGDDALRMLIEKDERLLSLPGIGAKTLERLHAAAVAHSSKAGHHQAVEFALGIGLSPPEAQALLAQLGPDLEVKVRRDPYCLCMHLPELGFNRVDHLARTRLDASADCAGRAAGAVLARLRSVSRDGHCFDDRVLLLGAVQRAISCSDLPAAKALRLARAALDRLRKDGLVHCDFPPPPRPGSGAAQLAQLGWAAEARDPQLAPYVYLQAAVREEEAVATAVRRRLPARGAAGDEAWGGGVTGPDSPGPAGGLSPRLSGLQRLAVLRCTRMGADAAAHGKDGTVGRLLVLTGGPGTGKTFTVRQIVRSWREQGKRVMLACPTARAASVLSESVGLPAKTIHRLLEYNPQKKAFLRDARAPLECDAVVIDEASMLDVNLAARFLEALRDECVVLFVGDANQLPSVRAPALGASTSSPASSRRLHPPPAVPLQVGPGAVLQELLASARVPRIELTDIFRQDPTGDIARNAALIHAGRFPAHIRRASSVAELASWRDPRPTGTVFVPARSEMEAQRIICGDVLVWLRSVGYRVEEELQVLSPLKRGQAGTVHLNTLLKQQLNPLSRPDASAAWQAVEDDAPPADVDAVPRLTVGDQVIQLINDYDHGVFNGDLGVVTSVRGTGKSYDFTVEFAERRREVDEEPVQVDYRKSAVGQSITLAYALTVHKAQGSEYEVVCMPVLREQSFMLFRNLLYTGVSRAKRLLVLVGSEDALLGAVANIKQQTRRTMLHQRISNDEFAPAITRHM